MSNIFQNVVTGRKKYNNFPLGREVLLSGQIGKLIPVQCDEIVPGDKYRQSAAFLCRFTPLSAPAMARFNVHFHSFYVPYRIITPETSRESTYERFIKSIGKHSSEVPHLPTMYGSVSSEFNPFAVGSLADYLGFPTTLRAIAQDADVSVLPFLAYQRIYQDFYRRDQLEQEVVYPSNLVSVSFNDVPYYPLPGDFPDLEENQIYATSLDLFTLQTRNYERDYFTSALPSPQFGDEVSVGDGLVSWLNMSENLDIGVDFKGVLSQSGLPGSSTNVSMLQSNILNPDPNTPLDYYLNSPVDGYDWRLRGTTPFTNEMGQALANNMQANTFTINEFRLAMQLQGIKEKINRVGTRYLEIMEGIYNVRVPDARLQRPIYLGGFKSSVTIGSVMQTSESNTTPQGTLTGQMSSTGSNNLVNGGYEFKEHGYLLTIMSITPRTSYFGGIPRKFLKRYPEEFYLPPFDHLGEQEIYEAELYVGDELGADFRERVFGYSPHYAELKSSLSTVHGEFRTTLANWHVSRSFDEAPNLNPDFIKAEPEDFNRIFAFPNVENTSNEHFYMQVYIDIVAKRNMSKYSTPYTLY